MEEDRLYTSICSAATLQSDKKGFFQDYADNVLELIGPKWIKDFQLLNSDEQRLLKCYNDSMLFEAIHGVLQNVQPLFRGKTAKLSQLRRMEGEKAAREGKLERAFLLLTQAIIRAPGPGEDNSLDEGLSLSLALWSRADTHWQLSDFKSCLADLQISLKEKLPEKFRIEAYYLMSQCYQKLKEPAKAKVALQVTLKMLGPDDVKWKEKIQSELNTVATIKEYKPEQEAQTEELLEGQHPQLPGLSAALSVCSGETTGRYAVASQHVKSGDVLAIEKPYVACLLPDKFGSHCHHCLSRLRSAVACKQCSGVAFCSVVCRDTAASSYHKYECHYMDLLIGSGMSILCHVALRTITQEKYSYWQKVYKKQPVTPEYKRLAELVTHADKRQPRDFISRTLMALFLLRVLEHSKYIPPADCSDDDLKGMNLFLGCVLLHLLQCFQFNAHEIYETIYKSKMDFTSSKINYIGVGIYPSVALFNHDCYPALARYFRGKEIVLRAVRPLEPGNTVAENYGPMFTLRTTAERQRSLTSRYWFTCVCQACTHDWPKLADMNEDVIQLRCRSKNCEGFITTLVDSKKPKTKCPKCGGVINISEAVLLIESYFNDYEQGVILRNEGRVQDAAQLFSVFSDVMHAICCPPMKKVCVAHEALRTCWAYQHNKYVIHS